MTYDFSYHFNICVRFACMHVCVLLLSIKVYRLYVLFVFYTNVPSLLLFRAKIQDLLNLAV